MAVSGLSTQLNGYYTQLEDVKKFDHIPNARLPGAVQAGFSFAGAVVTEGAKQAINVFGAGSFLPPSGVGFIADQAFGAAVDAGANAVVDAAGSFAPNVVLSAANLCSSDHRAKQSELADQLKKYQGRIRDLNKEKDSVKTGDMDYPTKMVFFVGISLFATARMIIRREVSSLLVVTAAATALTALVIRNENRIYNNTRAMNTRKIELLLPLYNKYVDHLKNNRGSKKEVGDSWKAVDLEKKEVCKNWPQG